MKVLTLCKKERMILENNKKFTPPVAQVCMLLSAEHRALTSGEVTLKSYLLHLALFHSIVKQLEISFSGYESRSHPPSLLTMENSC